MSKTDHTPKETRRGGAQSKRDRAKARRQERLERERAAARKAAMRRRLGFVVGAIVLVGVLLGVAQLLSGGGDPEVADDSQPAEIAADASALPPYSGGGQDQAVGQPAPEVAGTDFDGDSVTIGDGGEPQALMFLAHWCPHCQRELPEVVDFVEQGRVPEGVQLAAVSTGHDQARPNWPPQAWLERENWRGPTLVDGDNSVADAYGLTATPFWVFLDGDGNVVQRASGEIGAERLETTLQHLVQDG